MFSQYLVFSYSSSVQIQINSKIHILSFGSLIIFDLNLALPPLLSLSLYPLSSCGPPISVRPVPFGPRMAYHLTSSCLCFSVSLFLPRLTHARTHTPSRLYIAFPHDVTRLSRRGTNTARGSQSIRRDAARRDVLN